MELNYLKCNNNQKWYMGFKKVLLCFVLESALGYHNNLQFLKAFLNAGLFKAVKMKKPEIGTASIHHAKGHAME